MAVLEIFRWPLLTIGIATEFGAIRANPRESPCECFARPPSRLEKRVHFAVQYGSILEARFIYTEHRFGLFNVKRPSCCAITWDT